MYISKVILKDFKKFSGQFEIDLNEHTNVLVGDNEAGKSTILEAINIALTGIYGSRYVSRDINLFLFNKDAVAAWLEQIKTGDVGLLPSVIIELYFGGEDLMADFNGSLCLKPGDHFGIRFEISFDETYSDELAQVVAGGREDPLKTLPIEYYRARWRMFSRKDITPRSIPLRSAFIDSTAARYQNGSDIYINRIIRNLLEPKELVKIAQTYRETKEHFMASEAISAINDKISAAAKISDKKVSIAVDVSSKSTWDAGLSTFIEDVPFEFVGKGEQSIVKSNLALSQEGAADAGVVLVEEPESHLSHSRLNMLLDMIEEHREGRQLLITTHSSFVANKVGLTDLVLLNNNKTIRLHELGIGTLDFFKKLAGYDTLRMILSSKTILVEGDSDELVVQKAFADRNDGKLPIQKGVEVISVGTSFLRFLELANALDLNVVAVTDNDGDVAAVDRKYSNYTGDNKKPGILVAFDRIIDGGDLMIGDKPYNYNTLEPKMLKANGREKVNSVLGANFDSDDALLKYMRNNKTEVALKFFETNQELEFPEYILVAIQ
ncbi:ATP-dependent nuclease [Thalassospira lucentensis]|uniref:ATP-dependent nuclease n=1 Tax=Thalassospira lucentensis TaxID=168935 RepID=UPI0003B780A7|nr:AAA family ATPase [Thalassospira lucentensis]RCK21966.1 DNA recombinase [Thalassospira lucentensis MCCC 1A00383 = DSM 14000]